MVCFNADTGYKEFIGVKIINKSEILLIVDEPINAQGVIYNLLYGVCQGILYRIQKEKG